MTGLIVLCAGLALMSFWAAVMCLAEALVAWDQEQPSKPYMETAYLFLAVALVLVIVAGSIEGAR